MLSALQMYQLQAPPHCSAVTPQSCLALPCCQLLFLDATCPCPEAGLAHIHPLLGPSETGG